MQLKAEYTFVCTSVQVRVLWDAGAVASCKPVLNTIALSCSCMNVTVPVQPADVLPRLSTMRVDPLTQTLQA